jgi:hypothetical protein
MVFADDAHTHDQAGAGAAALLSMIPAGALEPTGREILEEQKRRHESRSEVAMLTMGAESRPVGARTRRLVVRTAKGVDNAGQSPLKYPAPQDIRNVGLLTWQQPGDAKDDRWMYLDASNQTERIVCITMRSGGVTPASVDSSDIGALLSEAAFPPQNIDLLPRYR